MCVPLVDCTEHHGSLYAGQDVKWWCSTTCFWNVVWPPTWSESGNLRGQGLECHGVFQGAPPCKARQKEKNVLSFFFNCRLKWHLERSLLTRKRWRVMRNYVRVGYCFILVF